MCPRKRPASPSNIYHVYNRGINRMPIFENSKEKVYFMQCLREAVEQFDVSVYAYCIMPNHMHLVLGGSLEEIGKFMQCCQGKYGTAYNFYHKREGHVFQNHFKSKPVFEERYFWSLIRYIHLNPVKAGLAKSPEYYRFSSFKEFTHGKNDSSLLTPRAYTMVAKGFATIQDFYAFHQAEDLLIYDDIEEEVNLQKEVRLQHMKEWAKNTYGVGSLEELAVVQLHQEDIIRTLYQIYDFSVAEIVRLTGITNYRIRKILGDF